MRFDDRLATVLRQPVAGETLARIQFRQLLDLLGTSPSEARGSILDAAHRRLAELSGMLPPGDRARILRDPALRLRNPRLVALLAEGEPEVAREALAAASLGEDEWLDLIPSLPVRARSLLRWQSRRGKRVAELLDRLGVAAPALPPARGDVPVPGNGRVIEHQPVAMTQPEAAAPTALASAASPKPVPGEGIGDIVRRIEAFRKTRAHGQPSSPAPAGALRLPLEDIASPATHVRLECFDFVTDSNGRITWSDAAAAPMVVGMAIAVRDGIGPGRPSSELFTRFRRRQPLAGATVEISGAEAISGKWQAEAAPRFDVPGGRFIGYVGRMRRLAPPFREQAGESVVQADRMRQMLHELRTPVNAIQGFAEVIQQQLFGPAPHEYRALAAAIASDSARILAGFEELDRLVKLEAAVNAPEAGQCDLDEVVERQVAQLQAYCVPRNSGFVLGQLDRPLLAAIAPVEADRIVWRLLATLAGAAAPGEMLGLMSREQDGFARISVRLPAAMSAVEGDRLFTTAAASEARALTGGILGSGFALRLARAEARAAGGSLERKGDRLCLSIPHLTGESAFHTEETRARQSSGAEN